jgi:hypothetical protein
VAEDLPETLPRVLRELSTARGGSATQPSDRPQ